MKTRYKILIESYNMSGVIAFIFNSLQSIFSDFIFGISYYYIFDYLNKKSENKIPILLFVILIFIYFIFFIPLWGYLMEKCEFVYKAKLGQYLFEHKLKNIDSKNEHSSSFLTLLQYDVIKASQIAGWNLVVFFQTIISGIISSIVIGILSFKILLILYVMGITAIITDLFCSHYIKNIIAKNREYFEERMKCFIEFINNILIIKIYNQEDSFNKKINQITFKITKNNIKTDVFESFTNFFNNIIYLIGFKAMTIIVGLNLIMKNELTFGKFLLIFSMINGIIFVAEYIGGYIKTLKKIEISSKKIDSVINDIKNRNSINIEKIENIKFENVKFKYNAEEKLIFNNLNLEFKFPNDYIILGNNATGKTTLLKLIFGLKKQIDGEIYINDMKLDKNKEYFFPFGYVPQEVMIYEGNILENIKLNKRNVSECEIVKILEIVELKEWVKRLDNGLYTKISEKGKNISKGEKARLSIARELLKNPEVLFLDEADANIDTENMKKILKNIKKNYLNTNLVVITHQPENDIYKNFTMIELNN